MLAEVLALVEALVLAEVLALVEALVPVSYTHLMSQMGIQTHYAVCCSTMVLISLLILFTYIMIATPADVYKRQLLDRTGLVKKLLRCLFTLALHLEAAKCIY